MTADGGRIPCGPVDRHLDHDHVRPEHRVVFLSPPEPVLTEEQWREYIARHPEPGE